jgi:hypothetical protein
MELDIAIQDFIDSTYITTKNQLQHVKNNDWSVESLRIKDREKQHDLQVLLTETNLANAKSLYDICNKDVSHKTVKAVMKDFLEFFRIYKIRGEKYLRSYDWSNQINLEEDSESEDDSLAAREIRFQDGINKNIRSFTEKVRKVNDGETVKSIDLNILNNAPIPLVMADMMEVRHPEILEYIKYKEGKKVKND